MINRTFTNNGVTYKRVSKSTARRLQKAQDIVIVPCNAAPFSPWALEGIIYGGVSNFDTCVSVYEAHYCSGDAGRELGRYASFYVKA